jgi:TetR/AcrR family transcriptional regulator, cholesterol catabolism regulator
LNERSTLPMPSRTPPPRDSEAKLKHILHHSATIFADRGFEGTSIRDLSRATGISLSGLYYYFQSKQNLLYLIQLKAFTDILESLQNRLAEVHDPEARLRIFINNHLEYFLSHPAEMKVLSHEEDALGEPYRKEIAAIKKRYYSLAREIFDELARQHSVDSANPRVAVLSLYGMMNWIYKWHNPKLDPGARQLSESIAAIFLHGVLNGHGTAKINSAAQSPFARVGAAE